MNRRVGTQPFPYGPLLISCVFPKAQENCTDAPGERERRKNGVRKATLTTCLAQASNGVTWLFLFSVFVPDNNLCCPWMRKLWPKKKKKERENAAHIHTAR